MRIVRLRDMGFGIEEIEEILPHYDHSEQMKEILKRKQEQIQFTIANEQNKLTQIAALPAQIKSEHHQMVKEVELQELPAVKVLSLREVVPSYAAEEGQWEKLVKFIERNHTICDLNGYSIYHDDEYKEADIDVEIAVPVSVTGET